MTKKAAEKKPLVINPYVLLFFIIVACAIAAYLVEPGAYDRVV